MRRFLTLTLTQVLLWGIFAEANHALAGFRVYLFVGALYVVFAALTQPPRSGIFVSCVGGLICDANSPVNFGLHLLLFALAHTILHRVRDRIATDDNISLIVVALLTNLALFLVFSFTQIHASPAPAAVWPRLIVDLVCSQVALALVTPWFFALQGRALALSDSVAARFTDRQPSLRS
ncbi:MAG: rod shape-determining protein MreD [Verrucomicrobiota bacterium]